MRHCPPSRFDTVIMYPENWTGDEDRLHGHWQTVVLWPSPLQSAAAPPWRFCWSLATMRLLLVEDDPMIGDSIRQGLRQDGFAVDWVEDGEAAELAWRTTG